MDPTQLALKLELLEKELENGKKEVEIIRMKQQIYVQQTTPVVPVITTPPVTTPPVAPTVTTPVTQIDLSKCLCRSWREVQSTPYKTSPDNVQCRRNCNNDSDICDMHQEKMRNNNGKFWLGLITEPRPEEPFGPIGVQQKPKRHYWLDQKP